LSGGFGQRNVNINQTYMMGSNISTGNKGNMEEYSDRE
jgi:hypothetical protein